MYISVSNLDFWIRIIIGIGFLFSVALTVKDEHNTKKFLKKGGKN